MESKNFSFVSPRSHELVNGSVYTLNKESQDYILFIHGFLAHKDTRLFRYLTDTLGLNCIRFNMPLTMSNGKLRYEEIDADVEDLKDTIDYTRLLMPSLNITGMIGHSRGANIIYFWLAKYQSIEHPYLPSLKWAIALAGRAIMESGPRHRFSPDKLQALLNGQVQSLEFSAKVRGQETPVILSMTKDMLLLSNALNPLGAAERINNTNLSILIIHGTDDEVVPVEDAELFYKHLKIPMKSVVRIPRANHNFSDSLEELSTIISTFIKDYFL